ncbi:non-repetitive nucleoporin [Cordyceps fumosorosea ARSEF 2679]|uniref:Non-repetitive nucleoporin n=1 Tax=Cordyceps fumosorosea (strain ARSEF 2679) TaxID=1081104 RepID=A0A167R7G7_CORFA|nr:non-repetitive nucleoporin [Cordyceps fumosorosea ARSEF 2679]OAA58342.1 non-repetitive nucleoporin [Cordyceps fumosorosea ARSEF 2679]
MSFPEATPVRLVPGAFLNTPAVASRFRTEQQDPVSRNLFQRASDPAQRSGAPSLRRSSSSSSTAHSRALARSGLAPSKTTGSLLDMTTRPDDAAVTSLVPAILAPTRRLENIPPVVRAARAINACLTSDENFPDIDSYCRQGASSDYEIPPTDTAWSPFHKIQMYPIPNQVFDHYNTGELQTLMGLFAEINHAWVVIDNSLFLWDYTTPDAELIGFEDQPHTIQAVALVPPKKGIFVNTITHILVVATSSEMILLGVSATPTPAGTKSVSLYQTKMSLPLRGSDVRVIAGSADGRIFFGGTNDVDISELYYQSEEKWFSNRCGKINHTNPGWASVVTLQSGFWSNKNPEHLIDIVIDDSRNLLYTLSSTSTIRTFHMEAPDRLNKVIEKEKVHCLRDIAHMISQSKLLTDRMRIVSISPISKQEASKIHLMAMTDTGCRIFFSATSASSYIYGSQNNMVPQSMQVQFIKFPPSPVSRRSAQIAVPVAAAVENSIDLNSAMLVPSRYATRFPPGVFIDFVAKEGDANSDTLFLSAPESARIKNTNSATPLRYYEQASWIDIGSRAEAVGLVTKPFAATNSPWGFGNELAVQFDETPPEVAILTNTGVHVVRRRRLVDNFAAAIRDAPGEEALDLVCRRLIQLYGRVETVSTALAVACGHGGDARIGSARAIDQATQDRARGIFVEMGGQPMLAETDGATLTTDSVRLSSRHDALSLYLSRLVRKLWKSRVIVQGVSPTGGIAVASAVPIDQLNSTQENLERLRKFIESNRGLIQGMSGPADLQRTGTRQEEMALQAEHQALHALQKLMESISEGISFVLMLFDERAADVFMRLEEPSRQQLRDLTYEALFSQPQGKDLAKVLVKAIVNRNIESGSNVETVADALRRRCGSFCSPDDVVIFKAQEQLKRASEQPVDTNQSRNILLESLSLFEKVAGSLTYGNLQSAISQYVDLRYYAGAVQLCLVVAREKDRGNTALLWIQDGKPAGDPRAEAFEERRKCYDMIHHVLRHLDQTSSKEPELIDGKPTVIAMKRMETYDVVNGSEDEVFHFDLYEWYIEQGWTDRILAIDSPHVVTFLMRLATTNVEHADLLCRFYTNRSRFFAAAEVQADLAQSDFSIGIKERIKLLSLAKANASVTTVGVSRQQQQMLNHDVSDKLDIANIQDDLLGRLSADDRIDPVRKQEIQEALDGRILDLSELFNQYADHAGYYDICLVIYHTANYRNPTTISSTWSNLIQQTHDDVVSRSENLKPGQAEPPLPYEAVSSKIQNIAHYTSLDSFVFPIQTLLPELCRYAVAYQQDGTIGADAMWPAQLFLNLGVSHSMIVQTLENIFDTQDYGFSGAARNRVIETIVFVVSDWAAEARRRGGAPDTGATLAARTSRTFGAYSRRFAARSTIWWTGYQSAASAGELELWFVTRAVLCAFWARIT